MEIKCYTDGSLINRGFRFKTGAWAYKIIMNDYVNYIKCGSEINTTSMNMEIEAIRQALLKLKNLKSFLNNYTKVTIYSDCKSIIETINNMLNNQKIKTKNKLKDNLNEIINLMKSIADINIFSFKWMKGHSLKENIKENYLHNKDVDKLAKKIALTLAEGLKDKTSKQSIELQKSLHGNPNMITKTPKDIEKYIYINDIIIPKRIRKCTPRENRKLNKFNVFWENGGIEKSIEVQSGVCGKYYLADGYISYLWLKENNEKWIPVKEIK
jgi:ribonuclease HI